MNEQEAIQQIQNLVIEALVKGDKKSLQQLQEISAAADAGDQKCMAIMQIVWQIAEQLENQQAYYARRGAKLNYIKGLRGKCPDGYDVKYYKRGGTLCKTCAKKKNVKIHNNGGSINRLTTTQEFKENWYRTRYGK